MNVSSEDHDEYDKSMMAKDSELPSDEEELAAQLKLAYHDQQALDEKDQIKRLKERFIQVLVLFRLQIVFRCLLFVPVVGFVSVILSEHPRSCVREARR